ncbi:MAG: GDSL-like Lipase/Acylhydrolase [Lentisphaerae bacterium ADurb.BinA184]|nr:MAG: GDSL-like Lipase/Acylhydrolase [Lentisphaerae bacterium ADurb.BinA184]
MGARIVKTCVMVAWVPMAMLCSGQDTGAAAGKEYASPMRFADAIRSFEEADERQAPPRGAIVCVGSSSMGGWHPTIQRDLAPLTIVARGFGGSTMNDALHYADRIVLPYKPRAVVVYEGDNDVAQRVSPQTIADTFQAFVEKVHKELPECRIYFLSIKPSIMRWNMWPKMKEANDLIAARCADDKRLTFVDVASGMLNEDGTPRHELFKEDGLHMTGAGYVVWRDALRPVLMQTEMQYEKGAQETDDATKDEPSSKPEAGDRK